MSTELRHSGVDPLEQADAEAVYRHAFEGEPLDPEVRRRVRERAAARARALAERATEPIDDKAG